MSRVFAVPTKNLKVLVPEVVSELSWRIWWHLPQDIQYSDGQLYIPSIEYWREFRDRFEDKVLEWGRDPYYQTEVARAEVENDRRILDRAEARERDYEKFLIFKKLVLSGCKRSRVEGTKTGHQWKS